jgi:hypothetical protein
VAVEFSVIWYIGRRVMIAQFFGIDVYIYRTSVQLDAEFAVNGTTNQLRLTHVLSTGTQVTVVKRTGTAWDSTVNIQTDTSKIAEFLKASPGIWYTDYKN